MSKKKEPPTSGIVLPPGAPAWARDRVKLWSEAERRERNEDRPDAVEEFIAAELKRLQKPHKRGISVTVHGCFDFSDFPADMFRDTPES